jgi:hypothetical protein
MFKTISSRILHLRERFHIFQVAAADEAEEVVLLPGVLVLVAEVLWDLATGPQLQTGGLYFGRKTIPNRYFYFTSAQRNSFAHDSLHFHIFCLWHVWGASDPDLDP